MWGATGRTRRLLVGALALLPLLSVPAPAGAGEVLAGPVTAEVLRTIDGDTLEVRASVWLGMAITTRIRIRGIDAPEIHGRCQHEKDMARAATERLAALVAGGSVRLSAISGGKYYGRVIADVTTPDGRAVGPLMLTSGLARAYDGGRREGWCDVARADG